MTKSFQSASAIVQDDIRIDRGREQRLARIAEFSRLLGPEKLPPMNMIRAASVSAKGYSLVSNKEFDSLPENHKNGSGRLWTGTLVISEREGRKFGEVDKEVRLIGDVFSPFNIVFEVPAAFWGKKGCLVLQHPDFEFVPLPNHELGENTYGIRILGPIAHVEGFPSLIGFYGVDHVYGLPIGESLRDGNGKTRFLDFLNRDFSGHISLVARDFGTNRINVAAKPAEKFASLAYKIIPPGDYVDFIWQTLQRPDLDVRIKTFIYDWMASDAYLQSGVIKRARMFGK